MLVDRERLKQLPKKPLCKLLGITYQCLWLKIYKGYLFNENEIEKILGYIASYEDKGD